MYRCPLHRIPSYNFFVELSYKATVQYYLVNSVVKYIERADLENGLPLILPLFDADYFRWGLLRRGPFAANDFYSFVSGG